MDALTENLSAILTVTIALSGAFYSMAKSKQAAQEKAFDTQIKNLTARVNGLSEMLHKTKDTIVSADEIRKMGMAITSLVETLTDIRLDTLKKDDAEKLNHRIDELSTAFQQLKLQIAHDDAVDDAGDKRLEEVIAAMQKDIEKCVNLRQCEFIHGISKERRATDRQTDRNE